MQLLWYEADDTERVLMDSDNNAFVEGADLSFLREQGTGVPQLRDKTESGPLQHGATLLLQRLKPRTIKLKFELHHASGPAEVARARRAFAKFFQINSKTTDAHGRLRWVTDVTREIKARPIGGLDFDWQWHEPDKIEMEIVLLCDNPLWYDPTLQALTWSQQSLNSVTFPFYMPIAFAGENEIYSTYEVTNAGEWETYPTIVVTGPVTDLVIGNLTIDERLSLPGVSIAIGEQVVFDLTPGEKRVYGAGERNLFGYLGVPNNLASWRLASAPEATSGANEIFVYARNTTDDSAIVMSWYNLYKTS